MGGEAYKGTCFVLLDMLKKWAKELDSRPVWPTAELQRRILGMVEEVSATMREGLQREASGPDNN